MRVLILSCSTGQGHNAAANAILECFRREQVECELVDPITFDSGKRARIVADLYINAAVHAPHVFGGLYHAGMAISSERYKSPVYLANIRYADALERYIEEKAFDAVVTTHLYPGEALTYLRRRGKLHVPAYFVATDYVCIPFTEELEMDAWFIPSRRLTSAFVRRGIPESRLVPTGIPVSLHDFAGATKAQTRAALGLSPSAGVILIMAGSMGFGNPSELLKDLLQRTPSDTQIVVFGGSNEPLKRQLRSRFSEVPTVTVLDYTKRVPEYIRACDVLLTKPGGLTSTEAAALRVPLVHTRPIPGCEPRNAAFFSSLGLSVRTTNDAQAAAAAASLLQDEERRNAMCLAQQQEINPNAAHDICSYLMEQWEKER